MRVGASETGFMSLQVERDMGEFCSWKKGWQSHSVKAVTYKPGRDLTRTKPEGVLLLDFQLADLIMNG